MRGSAWSPGPAGAAGTPAASSSAGARLDVRGGDGLLLTRRGATARLSVAATAGGKPVPVPGTLRYASSAPKLVSVNGNGLVTALTVPGSAVITVTSTAAGVAPAAVTVATAQLTSGTVNLTPAEVRSVSPGHVTLVRDPVTSALRDGSLVVAASAGLVARLSAVAHGETAVTARTARVPLTKAFRTLRVGLSDATPAASVVIRGRNATVRDAAGVVVARLSSVRFGCTGGAAGVTISPPAAALTMRGQLVAQLSISPVSGLAVTLEPGVTVSGRVSLGAVRVTTGGSVMVKCSLTRLPGISLPLPAGLPPIGSVAVTVSPSLAATLTAVTGSAATIRAPAITDTWSALAGIRYSTGHGWSAVHTETATRPAITGAALTAPGRVSVSVKLGPRVDLGLAVSTGGVTLAGIDLAWAELAGTFNGSLASPYSDLDLGYTGPRYTVGTEFSTGLEVSEQDSALTRLLSLIGLTPPVYTLTLLDEKLPLFSQPVPAIRSADSTLTAGQTTDTLTSTVGPAWNGAAVTFLLFPATAAPARPTGTQIATATVAAGTATARWQPAAATAPGPYVLVAELTPATGFLPFPAPKPAPVTITAAAPAARR